MLLGPSLIDLGPDVRAAEVAIVDASGNQITSFTSVAVAPSTATRTNVNRSNTDVLILAANASRKGFLIANDTGAKLSIGFGATPTSATSFTFVMASNDSYEGPIGGFTGEIRGIWSSSGSGAARVTELT